MQNFDNLSSFAPSSASETPSPDLDMHYSAYGAISGAGSPVLDNPLLNRVHNQYSSLSQMFLETATKDDPLFSADLDRVFTWFNEELTHSQRLTAAFTLFSNLGQSDRDFILSALNNTVVVATEPTELLGLNDSKRSLVVLQKNRMNSIVLKPGQSLFSNMKTPLPSQPSNSVDGETFGHADYIDSFSSAVMNNTIQSNTDPNTSTLIPPGFTPKYTISCASSTTNAEAEQSPQRDLYLDNFAGWLRFFRLHKYGPVLTEAHDTNPQEFLKITDEALESLGVAALGARRKFLKLFHQILEQQ